MNTSSEHSSDREGRVYDIFTASYSDCELNYVNYIIIIIVILGLIGNIFLIFPLVFNKTLRTPSNILIASLAIYYILWCVVILVNRIVILNNLKQIYSGSCPFSIFCKIWTCGISIYHLACIALQRYISVVHPENWILKNSLTVLFQILFSWLVPGVFCIPAFIGPFRLEYTIQQCGCAIKRLPSNSQILFGVLAVLLICIPFIIILFSYGRIYQITHKSRIVIRNMLDKPQDTIDKRSEEKSTSSRLSIGLMVQNKQSELHSRQSKVLIILKRRELYIMKLMIIIKITFIITFFPSFFIDILDTDGLTPVAARICVNILTLCGIAANFIIYGISNQQFRQFYDESFKTCYRHYQFRNQKSLGKSTPTNYEFFITSTL